MSGITRWTAKIRCKVKETWITKREFFSTGQLSGIERKRLTGRDGVKKRKERDGKETQRSVIRFIVYVQD